MSARDEITRRVNFLPRALDPEHRIKALLHRVKVDPKASDPDPIVDQVLRALRGDVRITDHLSEAFRIWLDDFKRGRLSAWIFAGADDTVVEMSLGITRPVTELYRRFFFDNSVFVDRLDREKFAHNALQNVEAGDDLWYNQLLVQAHRHGVNVLVSLYTDKFSPDAAITRVARDLFMEYIMMENAASAEDISSRRDLARMLLTATKAIPPVEESGHTAREQAAIKLRDDVEAERMQLALQTGPQLQIIH